MSFAVNLFELSVFFLTIRFFSRLLQSQVSSQRITTLLCTCDVHRRRLGEGHLWT